MHLFNENETQINKHFVQLIVLQISRLSEGSTGQIFATSTVIYQIKMWSLWFLKVVDDTSDSEY